MRRFFNLVMAVMLVGSLGLLSACGGGGGGASAPAVSGIAATGSAIANATVTLIDSKGVTKTATTSSTGTYSIAVTGLTPPYLIKVDAGSGKTLYGYADDAGTVNLNPFSDLIVRSAAGGVAVESALTAIKAGIATAKAELQSKFGTMLTTYGVPTGYDPIASSYTVGNALDKLFDAIRVTVTNNGSTITITNAGTGATIYTATIGAGGAFTGTLSTGDIPQPPATPTTPQISGAASGDLYSIGNEYFYPSALYQGSPTLAFYYGILAFESASVKANGDRRYWNGSAWSATAPSGYTGGMPRYILTPAGWVKETYVYAKTANSDGSYSLTNQTTGISLIGWTTLKQELSGLKMADVPSASAWTSIFKPNATFGSGAQLYEVHDQPLQDYYQSHFPEPGMTYINFSGASSLAELFTSYADGSGGYLSGVSFYRDSGNRSECPVDGQFATGNSVKLYKMDQCYSGNRVSLGSGTWANIVVNGQTLLMISIPDNIKTTHDLYKFDVFFVAKDGKVYPGQHYKANIADQGSVTTKFNKAALDQMLLNTDTSKM